MRASPRWGERGARVEEGAVARVSAALDVVEGVAAELWIGLHSLTRVHDDVVGARGAAWLPTLGRTPRPPPLAVPGPVEPTPSTLPSTSRTSPPCLDGCAPLPLLTPPPPCSTSQLLRLRLCFDGQAARNELVVNERTTSLMLLVGRLTQLTHLAFDALLVAMVLAGVKRSTGLACAFPSLLHAPHPCLVWRRRH